MTAPTEQAAPARPEGRHNIRPELWALAVPIDTLTPHPRNPNDGDPEAIAESLTINGQYRPIVVWRRPDGPGVILAGNTTYAAAMSLDWQQLARTEVVADTEAEATRILLADNRYARLARMNIAEEIALLQELDALGMMPGTGSDQDDLDDLLAAADAVAVLPLGVTDARYAETTDEQDARAAARAGGTFEGRGVREMLLLFASDQYDEVNRHLSTLRGVWGAGLTNAQVFAKAAEVAVEHEA